MDTIVVYQLGVVIGSAEALKEADIIVAHPNHQSGKCQKSLLRTGIVVGVKAPSIADAIVPSEPGNVEVGIQKVLDALVQQQSNVRNKLLDKGIILGPSIVVRRRH